MPGGCIKSLDSFCTLLWSGAGDVLFGGSFLSVVLSKQPLDSLFFEALLVVASSLPTPAVVRALLGHCTKTYKIIMLGGLVVA